MQKYSTIQSHSQFQPLKEIMLGGIYPDSFFDHMDNKTQDICCYINELTRKDLSNIKTVLESFQVHVVEPKFHKVDDYLDEKDNLIRPPITPCDYYLVLNDTLYVIPQYDSGVDPYQHAIDKWKNNNQKVVVLDRNKPDPMVWCSFASVVRLGQDIIIDHDPGDPQRKKYNLEYAEQLAKHYTVHVSDTGDHLDSVFCPIKPGLLLSSHYHTNHELFEGWEILQLKDRTDVNRALLPDKAQWWLPEVNYAHYNINVLSVAEKWLGNPVETVFDVNNVVIDEDNILMNECDDQTLQRLETLGVNVHWASLQTKFFWDAGLHCLTRDTHRLGDRLNYWPNRKHKEINWVKHWN